MSVVFKICWFIHKHIMRTKHSKPKDYSVADAVFLLFAALVHPLFYLCVGIDKLVNHIEAYFETKRFEQ